MEVERELKDHVQVAEEVERHDACTVVGEVEYYRQGPDAKYDQQRLALHQMPFNDRCFTEPVEVVVGVCKADEAGYHHAHGAAIYSVAVGGAVQQGVKYLLVVHDKGVVVDLGCISARRGNGMRKQYEQAGPAGTEPHQRHYAGEALAFERAQ